MFQVARCLVRYRGLLWTLVQRELRARYRGSVLGYFWSLLNPLLLLAVYSFVFGLILKRGEFVEVEPYGVFLVTGLFPWIWVSTSLLEGCSSLTGNSALIRKAVFPVEVLPAVAVVSNLMHFLLALPIVAVALIVGRLLGYPIAGWTFVLLPLVLVIETVMVAGLAFALSALNVHFKDVRDLLGNVLVLLFFLAPIIYTLSDIPARTRAAGATEPDDLVHGGDPGPPVLRGSARPQGLADHGCDRGCVLGAGRRPVLAPERYVGRGGLSESTGGRPAGSGQALPARRGRLPPADTEERAPRAQPDQRTACRRRGGGACGRQLRRRGGRGGGHHRRQTVPASRR